MRSWSRVCIGISLVVAAAVLMAGMVSAGVPKRINYQGRLTDSVTGLPIAGPHTLILRIYDGVSGGSLLWWEPVAVEADSTGVFATVLGSVNPIDVGFEGPRWLEVEADGEILLPRREMVSVPYAFRADSAGRASRADSLAGHGLGEFMLRSELSTGDGAVNEMADPVDWTKIKNVPTGFADGADDTGAGDGYSLDAADGDPTNAVYVDNAGNVGIGTAAPEHKIHIVGEGPRVLLDAPAGNPEVNFKLAGDSPGQVWALYKESFTGDLRVFQGGDRVTIQNGTGDVYVGGNVGVGTASPTQKLDVNGNINTASTYMIRDTTVLFTWQPDEVLLVGPNSGRGSDTEGIHKLVAVGDQAGYLTRGNANTFVGYRAGYMSGNDAVAPLGNTFIGQRAGSGGNTGDHNTFLGSASGANHANGQDNTFVGEAAGGFHTDGSYNTMIGRGAGFNNMAGSGNVFLGYDAGYFEGGSNKLYIANGQGTEDVLIYGDFSARTVGIGTVAPEYTLHVDNPSNGDSARAIYGVASSTGDGENLVGVYGETRGTGLMGSGAGICGRASSLTGISMGVWGVADGVQGTGVSGVATHPTGGNVGVYGRTESPNGYAGLFEGGRSYFGGNVGIGAVEPERKLHIKGEGPRALIEATAGNPEVNFKTSGDATSDVWAIYKHVIDSDLHFYQNGDRVTIQKNTGNVGIGATDPGPYKLYVSGDAYSTGSWQSSDARLKTGMQPIAGALSKVLQLEGLSFLWRTEEYPDRGLPAGRHYGLIAQEVEQVLPEVVKEGVDGEKAVAYSELIPVLVEAVKDLKADSDELRAENLSLRKRLEALEKDGGR